MDSGDIEKRISIGHVACLPPIVFASDQNNGKHANAQNTERVRKATSLVPAVRVHAHSKR
jgi:hypothetical protein